MAGYVQIVFYSKILLSVWVVLLPNKLQPTYYMDFETSLFEYLLSNYFYNLHLEYRENHVDFWYSNNLLHIFRYRVLQLHDVFKS